MSYYGKTLLPLERPRLDEDFGCEAFDIVEMQHRRHLALGEDDPSCYCAGDAEEHADSLREVTEGWEDRDDLAE